MHLGINIGLFRGNEKGGTINIATTVEEVRNAMQALGLQFPITIVPVSRGGTIHEHAGYPVVRDEDLEMRFPHALKKSPRGEVWFGPLH